MEPTGYEKFLNYLTVNGGILLEPCCDLNWVKERVEALRKRHPWVFYNQVNGLFQESGIPSFYEFSLEKDMDGVDFVQWSLDQARSNDFVSFWLYKSSKHNCLVVNANHSVTDGPLIGLFLSDLVGHPVEYEEKRPNVKEMLDSIEENVQQFSSTNTLAVPINPSPEDIHPRFNTHCYSYDISDLMSVCTSLNVKPQAVLSVAELWAILHTLDQKEATNVMSMVSVNNRKNLNLKETSPLCPTSVIFIENSLEVNTTVKELIVSMQKKLDVLVPQYSLGHFKAFSFGRLKPPGTTSSISNIGKLPTENNTIFVTGGAYFMPDTMKCLRNFTHHALTSGNKLNITLTYLSPGCDNAFVGSLVSHFDSFMSNISNKLDERLIQ